MKKYPNNGPSLHIQTLMMSPRKNREALKAWAKDNKQMRPETLAVINLK